VFQSLQKRNFYSSFSQSCKTPDACIARCDGDNACLGYSYRDNVDCLNFYGTSRLTVTWNTAWEEGSTTQFASGTIVELSTAVGNSSAICMKKLSTFYCLL